MTCKLSQALTCKKELVATKLLEIADIRTKLKIFKIIKNIKHKKGLFINYDTCLGGGASTHDYTKLQSNQLHCNIKQYFALDIWFCVYCLFGFFFYKVTNFDFFLDS